MAAPSFRVLLVDEGPTDDRVAAWILHAVLVESTRRGRWDWVDLAAIPIALQGPAPGEPALRMRDVGRFEEATFGGRRAPFGAPLGKGPAKPLRRVLRALDVRRELDLQWVDGLVWLVDTDGDVTIRTSLESELTTSKEQLDQIRSLPVVVGCANECIEAWMLLGFLPRDARERELLERWRTHLGLDPSEQPHRLKHQLGLPRSIKPVFGALLGGDEHRQQQALAAAIGTDRAQAESTGLMGFVHDLRDGLLSQLLGP